MRLARLESARQRSELALDVEIEDLFHPSSAERIRSLEVIPGYGFDRMMIDRGCNGRLRSIHGTPYLVALEDERPSSNPEELCNSYLSSWGDLWELGEDGMDLMLERLKIDDMGGTHCIYRQTFTTFHSIGRVS